MGDALTRALGQPGSPDEPTVVQTTALTKPYTIHCARPTPCTNVLRKMAALSNLCPVTGAEGSAPEQHATSPTESNFDLPLAFSGSNESPNQTLHNAHAYY